MLSIKELTKLEKKSFRDETGLFLIEGKKVFTEAKKAKMKMEQILVAPFDGIVAELKAVSGTQVSEGTLLVRIEEREA